MATRKPLVISIINAKGGVGKTTTTVNLGAGLALRGYKVLLIDIDLQANLTHSLIGDISPGVRNIAEALVEETGLDGLITATATPNLFLVPAGESLTGIDLDLSGKTARESILKHCIQDTRAIKDFDIVLIDNPPYFSLATLNSLVASTHYLVPLSCEYLPMVGVRVLEDKIQQVKKKLNNSLQLLGILLTMYDKREGITRDIAEVVREEFAKDVFSTVIRINTKYKAIPIDQQTIFQYEDAEKKQKKGSEDYESLTDEVVSRLEADGLVVPRLKVISNG
jgi:chromosome partitioning protein